MNKIFCKYSSGLFIFIDGIYLSFPVLFMSLFFRSNVFVSWSLQEGLK